MRIFLFIFFILLSHTAYGEYVEPNCSGNKCDFVTSIVMLPALDSEAHTRCGGALISMQWSITVAHCVENLFRIRTERAVGSARRRSICIRAGFNGFNPFDHRSVKRYVKNAVDNAIGVARHALALVESEIPFIPKPYIRPIRIPIPHRRVKICEKPRTVTVVPVIKKPEIKICRPVKIIPNANCSCPSNNNKKTPPSPKPTSAPQPAPTPGSTNKPHTEPSLICGETQVPGQSRNLPVIEAEEESTEELKKDVLKMSSCVGAIGSCLVCNDVLVGIQNRCRRGGARGGTAEVVFTGIESYVDFIAATVKDDLPSKNKTDKPPTSRADILKQDVWMVNLVAAIGTFYFVYF